MVFILTLSFVCLFVNYLFEVRSISFLIDGFFLIFRNFVFVTVVVTLIHCIINFSFEPDSCKVSITAGIDETVKNTVGRDQA